MIDERPFQLLVNVDQSKASLKFTNKKKHPIKKPLKLTDKNK